MKRLCLLLIMSLFSFASADSTAEIGSITWYTDYDEALVVAKEKGLPLWVHFGENPGWAGCRAFASGPLRDKRIVDASKDFVPVFVDTLGDYKNTERFGERFGSYPVLRIHDHKSRDIGGRIDTNRTAGIVGATELLNQFKRGLKNFKK